MYLLSEIDGIIESYMDEVFNQVGAMTVVQLYDRVTELYSEHGDIPVKLVDRLSINTDEGLVSYRGYYQYPSLQPSDRDSTLKELMECLKNSLENDITLYGYKGGEYSLVSTHPVWVSSYGSSSGDLIVGLYPSITNEHIIIVTAKVD